MAHFLFSCPESLSEHVFLFHPRVFRLRAREELPHLTAWSETTRGLQTPKRGSALLTGEGALSASFFGIPPQPPPPTGLY